MKSIILAGGFGTRLFEETAVIPKPMIEIGGRPLLWHIMKILAQQGCKEFVVALGYKGDVIRRYFLEYPNLGADITIDLGQRLVTSQNQDLESWRVELIDTGLHTGTAGRLKRLGQHVRETSLFTYGDGLANIDLQALLRFHRAHGKLATVTAVRPPQRFGVLSLQGDRVVAFNEKKGDMFDHVNGGYFLVEPGVLDYIDGDDVAWEREPCERLASDGQLMAYQHAGFWQCVDTLHELRILRERWDAGEAPWKIWV